MSDIKPGYLRVSEVLSAFSGLDKIDPDVLKTAADRGTVVHQYIDSIIAGHGRIGLDESVEEYCRNAEQFPKEKKLVNLMLDSFEIWAEGKDFLPKPERFYDDELMLTGEADILYLTPEKQVVLVDFKTPVTESKSWLLQGSAYWQIGWIDYEREFYKIEFVQLDRKGKAPKSYFYEPKFELFKATLDTYRYFKMDGIKDLEIDYL